MSEVRRWLVSSIMAVCLGGIAAATDPPVAAPLLDREWFFGDPEISGAQISPDGKYIAFLAPLDGTRNVWVKKSVEPFGAARPLTADTERPIPAFFWSRDSRYILFVQDRLGDENFNVYAVDPGGKPESGRKVPPARNLTAVEGARALIYAVPKSDPDVLYVGLNGRDPAWHDLYRVRISTAERTLLRENTHRIAGWGFDTRGNLRLAERAADNGDTEVLVVESDGFRKVYSCSVLESCSTVRFHKDGRRLYLTTNRGEGVDLTRLVLLDLATGQEEVVESDPAGRVDFGGAMFSERTDELLATTYDDERARVYWRDEAFARDHAFLEERFADKDIRPGSATADERMWLIGVGGDTEPGETYLFDRAERALTLQYRVFEKLPREHLAPMQAVSYPSSDGLTIPAFLTLPKGVAPAGLPLILFPHGGPWSRDGWGYDPFAQILANRGYAVLQPNFRGSTGYGEKFLNAGNREWGGKMQDDLTWGVKHLVARGIADPKRVGIMGGSYGGYAALAGAAFTPDVYAAAVSIVGPSNLITLLDSIPPYWEAARKVFYARMGDPSIPEGRAQLERQSPLGSASKIRTPLLVVQGANDPRVKKSESDQIVVALRERQFPVEYLVAPDEGHGFARPVNNLAMFAVAEKFLAKHLGGRFQADMSPAVAARVADLSVDVKSVTVRAKTDPTAVGRPAPVATLRAGSSSYRARIEAGGQTLEMTVQREIADRGDSWEVSEAVSGAMGESRDRVVLDHATLEVRRRSVTRGPMTIEVEFADRQAAGMITVGHESDAVLAELGGAVFADGPGASDVLATLPLAPGYSTMFRNFDLESQKERIMEAKVAGAESVTVPAGTFETWRLEVVPVDGEGIRRTVWVARDSRSVVKSAAVVPQAGGMTMVAELLP